VLAADSTAAAADTAKAADDTATAETPAELAAWNAKMQKAQAAAADVTADGSKVARALDELCAAADSMGDEVLNAGAAAAEKAPSKSAGAAAAEKAPPKSAGKQKLEEQQKQIKKWRAQLAMVGGKAQQQVKGTAQQQVKQEAAGTAADGNSNSTPPESKPKSATKPPIRPKSKAPPEVKLELAASGVVLCLYRFVFIFYLWKDFKDMCYCFV